MEDTGDELFGEDDAMSPEQRVQVDDSDSFPNSPGMERPSDGTDGLLFSDCDRPEIDVYVFDIETMALPDEELVKFIPKQGEYVPLPQFDPSSVRVGHLKVQTKIDAKILQAKNDYATTALNRRAEHDSYEVTELAKLREKAALSPLTGKVVAIGIMRCDGTYRIIGGEDEPAILGTWWEFVDSVLADFVGHSSNRFDWPFLIRRSWTHGIVELPDAFRDERLPRCCIDTAERATFGRYGEYISLNDLALSFGLPGKPDDCDGEAFAEMYLSGDERKLATAIEYLKYDLQSVWSIAARMDIVNDDVAIKQ